MVVEASPSRHRVAVPLWGLCVCVGLRSFCFLSLVAWCCAADLAGCIWCPLKGLRPCDLSSHPAVSPGAARLTTTTATTALCMHMRVRKSDARAPCRASCSRVNGWNHAGVPTVGLVVSHSRACRVSRGPRVVSGGEGASVFFRLSLTSRRLSLLSERLTAPRCPSAGWGARCITNPRFRLSFLGAPGRPETDDDPVGRVAAECASFGSLCWGFSVLSLPLSLQCRLSSLITDAGRVAAEVHWALAACARMLLHLRACCCVG